MKLGVVGSRRRNSQKDKNLIRNAILTLKPDELVSGGCYAGADKFAEEISIELNIPIKIFYPKIKNGMQKFEMTKEYYARNKEIAEYSDVLLAVVAKDRTGGTEHTIRCFIKKNGINNLIII
jgi:hypothetical protein